MLFIQGFLAAESNLLFNHHFPLLFSHALCASATIRELLTLFQAQLYTLSQTNFSQESFHLLWILIMGVDALQPFKFFEGRIYYLIHFTFSIMHRICIPRKLLEERKKGKKKYQLYECEEKTKQTKQTKCSSSVLSEGSGWWGVTKLCKLIPSII